MSFRGFTLLEIMSISTPWVTPEHPERLSLLALLSTAGMIRFIEAVHTDVLGVLTDEERARLGLLRDSASLKNVRHDVVSPHRLRRRHLSGKQANSRTQRLWFQLLERPTLPMRDRTAWSRASSRRGGVMEACPTGAISFPVHGRAAVRFSQ